MSLDKKGFAELFESAINEFKFIKIYNRNFTENAFLLNKEVNDIEYKYNKCMEKLTSSKMERLYSILSVPAYSRIIAMTDKEVEEYRKEKLTETASQINRLMLAMEVSLSDDDKKNVKKRVEELIEEQTNLKEMVCETLKQHIIDKLGLENFNKDNIPFDGKEETAVLQKVVSSKETLTEFIDKVKEYRKLESEIKSIRAEQIIIYNDLLNGNATSNISIEELFDEKSLNNLQSTIRTKVTEIGNIENNLKKHFNIKARKAFNMIKSNTYKNDKTGKILPYENAIFEIFEEFVPSKTLELANLQNEEWSRLNKKTFKTSEVSGTIAILTMEIDETKKLIDSFVRNWYKTAYYDNSLFGPISSRISGKFEYSLGAKNTLDEFINLGVWPEEKTIDSLKLCLKLNRIEAEKTIIYAEQIKERMTRLFNSELDKKKKELEKLDEKISNKFGNWKNNIILSIANDAK